MSKKFHPDDYVAVHENPVWKDHSDFIIRVFLEEQEDHNDWEQLWAKKIEKYRFMICCIPFFAYNLSLGDEVVVDSEYNIKKVVLPSGHSTFRVWFGDSKIQGISVKVSDELSKMNAILEWSSENLLAISAENDEVSALVANYLLKAQEKGELIYETGRM